MRQETRQALDQDHGDITTTDPAATEEKAAQAQLHQSERMEALGRLAGGIAHDFNNLLVVIINYATFLLESFPEDDPRRGDVEEIRRAGERGARLVKQLVSVSRREVAAPRWVDLNPVVLGAEEFLRRMLGDNLRLTFRQQPGLWSTRVDPRQIEHILFILALNARDAMAGDGRLIIETTNVTIEKEQIWEPAGVLAGDYVSLMVTDTALATTDQVRAHIFEPIWRTKAGPDAIGLGLATVYGLVEQANGRVSVHFDPERGTTFRIYFRASRNNPLAER